jgi:hypothetical protein
MTIDGIGLCTAVLVWVLHALFYELDGTGRSAREEVASSLGISRCSIASTGNAMAVSDLKLNYLAPLKVRVDDDDPGRRMPIYLPLLVCLSHQVMYHTLNLLIFSSAAPGSSLW